MEQARGTPFLPMPDRSALPGSPPATANYTFSDSELQLLLTSLDRGAFADELLGAGPGSQSLQFLPHLPGAAHDSPEHAPAVFVPADLSLPQLDGTLLPLPLLPSPSHDINSAVAAAQLQPTGHQQREHLHSGAPNKHAPPQQVRSQGQRAGRAATASCAAPGPPNGAKPPHSFVEKQRRDRINCLIDELRELVPPQGSDSLRASATDGDRAGECRRPKHVVLADAIRLIRNLQLQAQAGQQAQHTGQSGQQRAAAAPQQASQAALEQQYSWGEHGSTEAERSADGQALGVQMGSPLQQQQQQQQQLPQVQQQADASQAAVAETEPAERSSARQGRQCSEVPRHHPQLPAAPDDDVLSASGVVVEAAEGPVRYVKVTCPDRHGLLADVVRALKELPLEITTAAITTRRDHVVYDVFQVEVEAPDLPDAAIASAVEAALRLPGEKKRRQASQAAPDLK